VIDLTAKMPIEEGWKTICQELNLTPSGDDDFSADNVAVMRMMFFAGACHYREMIKEIFDSERCDHAQSLVDISREIDRWKKELRRRWT
jgi:hypothetical protein